MSREPTRDYLGFFRIGTWNEIASVMTTLRNSRALHLVIRGVLALLSLVLIVATLIPLSEAPAWQVRIFDFPRLQLALMMAVALGGYVAWCWFARLRWWDYTLAALLVASLVWQTWRIAPYTPLFPDEVAGSRNGEDASRISLIVANVLYDNREVDAVLALIREHDPDMVLLTEPTQWWRDQLEELEQDYPHTVLQPQENHYGMLLYSRLELLDPEVRFLVESEIPSIRTRVRLASGEVLTFFGVHPRPPGLKPPGEDDREDSGQRDAELVLVAREVESRPDEPAIVAGDFNDVAWSQTTSLFQQIGGLLDPRIGRGLYNTYDVRSQLLRYPLDHVFVSSHFRLVELRRLPDVGSDHFPMLAILDYDPGVAATQDEPEADAEDQEDAQEAVAEEE